MSYAGGADSPNSSYYLNTGEIYWTMSPSSFYGSYVHVYMVSSGGDLGNGRVVGTLAVVPAVSLKPEATVKRGTGAYNDPYVINTD